MPPKPRFSWTLKKQKNIDILIECFPYKIQDGHINFYTKTNWAYPKKVVYSTTGFRLPKP